MSVPDDCEHFPGKLMAFFRRALEQIEFDWLFKCDDETYVDTERLTELAVDGVDLVGNCGLWEQGLPSAGAGYLLSRRIVEKLVREGSVTDAKDEDRLVLREAMRLGAVVMATDRLRDNAHSYGNLQNLRGRYIPAAVGCKRAGIRALQVFLESGAETGLICQDDCQWDARAGNILHEALAEIPDDWEMIYFSAAARKPHRKHSQWWVQLAGARLCTAILWRRETAIRLLPALQACDCEWDYFMERSHPHLKAYAVIPMPARQARSRSDITGSMAEPANW